MSIGKIHKKVYKALKRMLPEDVAEACFVKLYNTTLHPSLLSDLDYECWADWELDRQLAKED